MPDENPSPPADDGRVGGTALPGVPRPKLPGGTPGTALPSLPGVAELVDAWTDVLQRTCHTAMSPQEVRNEVRAMVATFVGALRRHPTSVRPLRTLGADMISAHLVGPGALDATLRLLHAFLVRQQTPPDRIASLIAALADSYDAERTRQVFEQQESLRRALAALQPDLGNPDATDAFRRAFHRSGAPQCVISGDTRVLQANNALHTLVGCAESMQGQPLLNLVHTDDAVPLRDAVRKLLANRQTRSRVVVRWQHEMGNQLHLELHLAPVSIGGSRDDPALIVVSAADISREQGMAELTRRLSERDQMTSLVHRVSFRERLAAALSDRPGRVAVACVRAHGLREINRTHGEEAGDTALRQIAERIEQTIGERGLTARISSSLFAALFSTIPNGDDADALAVELRMALATERAVPEGLPLLRTSVVVLHVADPSATADMVLAEAEERLRRPH